MDEHLSNLTGFDFFLVGLFVGSWFDRWTLSVLLIFYLLATNRPIAGIPTRTMVSGAISFFRAPQETPGPSSRKGRKKKSS